MVYKGNAMIAISSQNLFIIYTQQLYCEQAGESKMYPAPGFYPVQIVERQ